MKETASTFWVEVLKSWRCHFLSNFPFMSTPFPFSNSVTFENHNLTLSPHHHWKRMQRNNATSCAHLQHSPSLLPKKWQLPKNGRPTGAICPSDCSNGSLCLVIISHFPSFEMLLSAITENIGGTQIMPLVQPFFSNILFVMWETREGNKRKEGKENWLMYFTSHRAPSLQ